MAKKKKTRPASPVSKKRPKPAGPSRLGVWLGDLRQRHGGVLVRALVLLVITSMVTVGVVAGLFAMERRVLRQREAAGPAVRYHVELAGIPAWMPPTLARFIARGLTTPDIDFQDSSLCREVYKLASKSPWIASVDEVRRIRKAGENRGAIRVRVKFRQAIARVRYKRKSYFVDSGGVVLPYDEVPQWEAYVGGRKRNYIFEDAVPRSVQVSAKHYIVIEGVRTAAPVVGQRWDAADLQEGLKLVKLLRTRKYVNQIAMVDVRNHGLRVSNTDPELRIWAQVAHSRATDILFGRFPYAGGGDWVISPQRKLKYLDRCVTANGGRLAGIKDHLDLRCDNFTTSLD
ncbi:MAG: hypothetical protein K8S55_00560 [Phycisphaerae bacterium]|nr:hypothetical protein [Phycisphaerae bacterium]